MSGLNAQGRLEESVVDESLVGGSLVRRRESREAGGEIEEEKNSTHKTPTS